jgi:hypothetical protein
MRAIRVHDCKISRERDRPRTRGAAMIQLKDEPESSQSCVFKCATSPYLVFASDT